ncbi:MAG: leucine--tRNA ligase, partial [Candidatus Sumerlaeia bacterium]|nr:leucine--tRNA ligase [Candidatus Sumerlaeia bacterium]
YKWTQWVFLQLYKAGLAYRDEKEVNFCPDCGTVIADEQVNPDGTCERHPETKVQRRVLPCWFFRITEFAEKLHGNHEWIDWSERTRLAQLNWIGKSTGAEVDFKVANHDASIRVYTTRPDTLFGATFMVIAPEHPLVDTIADPAKKGDIEAYRKACAGRSQEERTADGKEKTGLDIGARAINPVNGEEIPVYIADYVMMGYGTGAIMAVPCGDHRDFAFAQKFSLKVPCIIDPDVESGKPEDVSGVEKAANLLATDEGRKSLCETILAGKAAWSGPGKLINSSNTEVSLDGLEVADSKARITEWLNKKGLGEFKTTFRLRDWGISRQRYWGPPIPILYDEEGHPHPVPEEHLPVTLPAIQDFRPSGDGRGPLANVPDWVNVEIDGKKYRRETDVMDNFLDSAWYYLRYVSTGDDKQAFDPELIKKWLPVDIYIGGNEHAVLHLLYTRFICMALEKAGALNMGERPDMKDTAEPFRVFRAHGLIVKDGAKMSKSRGNVVNPDEYVDEHGADTLRLYLMFLGPYLQGGDFRDKDIQGMRRFLNRLHAWYFEGGQPIVPDEELPRPLRVKTHQTIRKVEQDIDNLSYNTAIAAIMELFNAAKAADAVSDFIREAIVLALAPFAPHFVEEIWREALGKKDSIWASGRYPKWEAEMTVLDEVEIVLQHQGKIKDRVMVSREANAEELEKIALANEKIQKALGGRQIRKVIAVPGRLVNIIG